MANEEVLRLRATVVSDQALADIRKFGRELGIVQHNSGRGAKQAATGFDALAKSVQSVGSGLQQAIPGMSLFGMGAAGIGVAAGMMIKSLGDTAKKITELRYASKELGMSEQALSGWASAAEKAGIAPEAMMSGLKNFKRNTEDFSMRIGELRGQMVAMGAGPVMARMNAATNQLDKMKEAFDFKDVLDQSDPSGMKSRRFFEMIGLGADAARLSWAEFKAEQDKQPILTEKQKADAKAYADALVDMGTKWDALKIKVGVKLFPYLSQELDKAVTDFENFVKEMERLQANWEKMKKGGEEGKAAAADQFGTQPFGPSMDWMNMTPAEAWGKLFGGGSPSGAAAPGPGRAVGGPVSRGIRYTVGEKGPEQFTPSTSGMIHPASSGADDAGASRIIQVGVFDALVEFKSYIEAGGAQGGGGGGIIKASLGGSGGGYGGAGGGYGGGGAGGGGGGAPSGANAPAGAGGQQASRPGADGQSGTTDGGPAGAQAPVSGTGAGAGVPGSGSASPGGSGGITAPAGTPIAKKGLATITTSTGKKFQVDERFKANFQGFINDYEKAGGNLGPDTGTLGVRPHNASGHPIGAAIDINQIGYGVRSKEGRGKTIDRQTENELAKKWGLVSGDNWRRKDTGHFGVESPAKARQALIDNGVPPDEATAIANSKQPNGQATETPSGDRNARGVAAPIRYNNPGAQYPNEDAKRFGMTDVGVIGGGHKIAGFPSPVHGAASNMDLLSKKYVGMTVGSAITKWSGSHRSQVPGYDPNMIITAEMAKDPAFMKPFFRTMQKAEAGKEWMSKSQLDQAYDMYRAGGAKEYAEAQKGTNTARIDGQVAPAAPNGQVNVTVNSNGTKASAEAKTDGDLFQKPQVKQHRQMQKTEDGGESLSI